MSRENFLGGFEVGYYVLWLDVFEFVQQNAFGYAYPGGGCRKGV
jgi:hypothetical protein